MRRNTVFVDMLAEVQTQEAKLSESEEHRVKVYFFSGSQYIRVTRGMIGPGTVDPNYPSSIRGWGWPDGFGTNGIDAVLYSGSKCYFFSGSQYIRMTRQRDRPRHCGPQLPLVDPWLGLAGRLWSQWDRCGIEQRVQVLFLLRESVHPRDPRRDRPRHCGPRLPQADQSTGVGRTALEPMGSTRR